MYKAFEAKGYPVDIEHINKFIEEVAPDRWDDFSVSSGVLLDFPLHMILPFLEQFVTNAYYADTLEFTKLVFSLWPRYMNVSYEKHNRTYPHNKVYEILYTIIEKLNEFKFLSADELFVKGRKLNGSRYYNWHLFGCIPLLNNGGIEVLDRVYKLHYDDAQDMLMFGLYQYEPKEFHQKLKEILVYWHENGNISYSGGTGMISELKVILAKYKQHPQYDLTKDKQLFEIFECYRVIQ